MAIFLFLYRSPISVVIDTLRLTIIFHIATLNSATKEISLAIHQQQHPLSDSVRGIPSI